MKFISTSLALAALVSASYAEPQAAASDELKPVSDAIKSATDAMKSASDAMDPTVDALFNSVMGAVDNLSGKYAEARDNINDIAKYATAYNASAALRKVHKEYMSALDAMKPTTTLAGVSEIISLSVVGASALSAVGEIVHEDFLFMAYSVNRDAAGAAFDAKLQEKKMSLDSKKEAEKKIQDEADTLQRQFTTSASAMGGVIGRTQTYKATIDLLNGGAKKEELEKPEIMHKILYRVASKTPAQLTDYADSLLRSDAMTVAVSALTTVFATVAIAGAFFM
jgi:hypothetical protein